jgi:mono/diheme cytochrome c family protein
MWRRLLLILIIAAGLAAAGFWWLSAPQELDAAALSDLEAGDPARGERMFWAGGCAACHAAPGSEGENTLRLGGGLELKTAFGVFVAPNISPHPEDGIGGWSLEQFANAMLRGVSPDGRHYYPAFPYSSYIRMTVADVADLLAFLQALPQAEGRAGDHRLVFPYTIRRGIGLWKRLHLRPEPVVALPADASEPALRGRYLVEGPGHCGECHTPRDLTGGLDYSRWLAGAAAIEGEGRVPNISPSANGIGDWSEADIVYYLETGFRPDFDSVGGAMVAVQKNLARLSGEDRAAIAAYLKAVPAVE